MSAAAFEIPVRVTEARGDRIAVSSGHHLASECAVETYINGGNIVDAAIVGAAVLGVVLPYANGIGGDGYILFYEAKTGMTHALNGTGAAPSGATLERFTDGIPTTGIHSVTVPGAVALWEEALALLGTYSLRRALEPAIRLARDGFPFHLGLRENIDDKRRLIANNPECARLFGGDHALGSSFRQPELARTLETIAESGAQEFYRGKLGKDFAGKIKAAGGLFSPEDMACHRTLRQDPLHIRFYGYDITTMPPNSVGLQLLVQLLALERAEVHALDPDSPAFWALGIECWRRSLDTTKDVVGDPRNAESAGEEMLRRVEKDGLVGTTRRTAPPVSGDTTNLVVIDDAGNAISLMQSVSGPFASGVIVPGTGILLNNRMRGFDTNPRSVNCVAPGRRPKHSLVPALVGRDARVFMAIGTPGAAGQPLTLAQVLSRLLAFGQDLKGAIQAPRWSVGLSNEIIVERATPPAIIEALRSEDPRLTIMPERHVRFGSVKAARVHDGSCHAVADYRRVAAAAAA